MEQFMAIAIEEAKQSLREGNSGFGAVVIRAGETVAQAHDTDTTQQDPTAHAEMSAIRIAATKLGRDLADCSIISTHEPCPMCATAILWSGIRTIAFGYSIKDSIQQGRRRIDLSCKEIFDRAGEAVTITANVCQAECALLYNRQVLESIKQLRNISDEQLDVMCEKMTQKRLAWYNNRRNEFGGQKETPVRRAYSVFCNKLSIDPSEAPIVEANDRKVVIHSQNFCPTLEACKILELDTRHVCARLTEKPMAELLKQVDPAIRFSRNYGKLRPYAAYCEEIIAVE